MNILFIVPYTPDLIRVRSYNLIRSLVRRGHSLTVVTLWSNVQEKLALEQLQKECDNLYSVNMSRVRSLANCLAALPASTPLQAVYCWHGGLAEKVKELLFHQNQQARFDVIHIEHLRAAQYGLLIQREKTSRKTSPDCYPPVVWDSVDCITYLFTQAGRQDKQTLSQLPARVDLKRTERYESLLLDKFERVLVTSQVDKNALLSLYKGTGQPAVTVLPNGVDLAYFTPDGKQSRERATLIVSGKMSYHANINMVLHLVQKILPLVWASQPEVKLWIVGKDPPREVLQLAGHPAVTVTGTVSDIRPYLHQATIAVAPIVYGAGIQNKVLEAMACGTPVISSPQAVSALSIQPGQEAIIAVDPNQFAQAILDLLSDPTQQRRLGEAGRRYAEERHDWGKISAVLENIYHEAIAQNQFYQQRKSG